jgi:glycine cleavage system H protein
MFMPVSGEILEMNETIEETPDVVNKDPYGKGWMVKIKVTNPSEIKDLMTPEKYTSLIGG